MSNLRTQYTDVETYMQSCMNDSAHDLEHVYRVLNYALAIAAHEQQVEVELLVVACLLHDIGRAEQLTDSQKDHAQVGADKAYQWLTTNNYDKQFAERVRDCISTHRFRSEHPPISLEAKILYDADKLDACGTIGMARTLMHLALIKKPLYVLTASGEISDGSESHESSLFSEYLYKLARVYEGYHTQWASAFAAQRQSAAQSLYDSLLTEVRECYALNNVNELLGLQQGSH